MTQLLAEYEISDAAIENLAAFTQALIEVLKPIFAAKMRHVDLVFPIRALVTDAHGYGLEISLDDLTAEPMVVRKDNPEGISDQQRFLLPHDLILTDATGRKEGISIACDFLTRKVHIMHYDPVTVN